MKVKLLSRVQLLVTPWTAAYQAPPPMGFSRQEYWSGVPLPSPMSYLTVKKRKLRKTIENHETKMANKNSNKKRNNGDIEQLENKR